MKENRIFFQIEKQNLMYLHQKQKKKKKNKRNEKKYFSYKKY